jgi:hypothetical protein
MWPFRRKTRVTAPAGIPDGILRVLTVLSPDQQISIGGIPSQAIAGEFQGDPGSDSADTFRPNPAFSTFMQSVIDTLGRNDPELQSEARRRISGSIGIIDLRTPEGVAGNVPLEDIVGIFEVRNGELGVYHPNGKHVVFSANGLVQLPPALRDLHIRELLRLKVESR